MEKNILQAASLGVALAVSGVLGCGGSGGGGSTPTTNTAQAALPCGSGTHQANDECVGDGAAAANAQGASQATTLGVGSQTTGTTSKQPQSVDQKSTHK